MIKEYVYKLYHIRRNLNKDVDLEADSMVKMVREDELPNFTEVSAILPFSKKN